MSTNPAERSLRDGDPEAALRLLQEQVRARPADAKLRIFLFQLLAILGHWERAATSLDVASSLDVSALAMAQTYRQAILCELFRQQVFQGRKSPMVLGQPDPWLGLLIESLLRAGRGDSAAATALRDQALEQAPESSGTIDGVAFSWIADADSRLGPVLEAIVNGRYYWVPFARITRAVIDAPTDLRDLVWMPAHLAFDNGGETVALIPARYVGSESSDDGQIALGRKTAWQEVEPGIFHGLGQRLLATDGGEYGVMDIREIVVGSMSGSRPAPTSASASTAT
ncbi:MAG TPA: type VI secretion system accessory protein TagJ [Steroidobacteraceae bacterium]|nr:type VI secretion system accessory protein TagJ [Steroidobacteraceae bacterium]